ncbi:CEF1 [Candida oxycetoniae]|uniref:Pre-mRNA-splicing factor CEF1 n=1 Tax=Candida oxycetoniae TaxID=497107 RepID=A0AAI9T1N5_9ASCO|nr:CEF1 [Candida oxycetoniae]KAI3406812.2 CEF1 [Candida oxycetoniae]
MSVYVKGGAWTNIEDEILKAAVQKYGINQWARVSSLLPKKTDLQAKARWNEWLDPTINKSSWSLKEDKRLLELTKLLPNQWRTIASVIGRTATQCIERFQKLLDEEAGITTQDLRLSGPGIETLPAVGEAFVASLSHEPRREEDLNIALEALPAIADENELEDVDREMLAEARARLANTQGKKAKRKARERMLEESKRIALLQKRRDMKAAGISISLKTRNNKKNKNKEFDYNVSIPHEIVPAQGPYDITKELKENEKETNQFKHLVAKRGISLKEVDDKIRSQQEKTKQSKNQKRKLQQEEEEEEEESKTTGEGLIQFKKRKECREKETLDIDTSQKKDKEEAELPSLTRKPNKSILPFIKGLFDKLPEPKHHRGEPKLVFEGTENEDESLSLVQQQQTDQMDQMEQLKVLSQIDKEKLNRRRTQVVQRNLPIPHPYSIKENNSPLNSREVDVEALVGLEVLNLVGSDYRKHQNPKFTAPLVTELDEELYNEVNQQIDQELLNIKKEEKGLVCNFELEKNVKVAENVIAKLHELYNSSEALQKQLMKFTDYEHQRDMILSQIEENYLLLVTEDEKLKLTRYQAMEEEKEMKLETQRLNHEVDRLYSKIDAKC